VGTPPKVFEDDASVASALAADLATDDPDRRIASVLRAGREGGERCVPLLAGALADPEERVRAAAAHSLSLLAERAQEHGDPSPESLARITPMLLAGAKDTLAEVRRAVLATLAVDGGDEAVRTFGAALSDENAGVRAEAVRGLWRVGGEDASQLAMRALGDADHLVRYYALCAVDELEPLGFADAIAARLSDARAEVAAEAAFLLAERRDARATPVLASLLKHRDFGFEAARLLGALRDPSAREAVARAAGRFFGDPLVRLRAAATLWRLGDASAEDTLLRALASWRKPVRGLAIELLAEEKSARAFDTLLETAKRRTDYHCSTAARALGHYRDQRAVETLVSLLQSHPDRDVREDAAWSLGEIGGTAADAALHTAATTDLDDAVREAARGEVHEEPASPRRLERDRR